MPIARRIDGIKRLEHETIKENNSKVRFNEAKVQGTGKAAAVGSGRLQEFNQDLAEAIV